MIHSARTYRWTVFAAWLFIFLIAGGGLLAQESPTTQDGNASERPEVVAIRKTAADFTQAFNAGDPKAIAALWTISGEYIFSGDHLVVGRSAIEQQYEEFFRSNPGSTIEITVDSVRALGPSAAIEQGTTHLRNAKGELLSSGSYSALHVHEADGWRMASVTEWPMEAKVDSALDEVDWLVGDWEASSEGISANVTYAWDDSKAYLNGRYTLRRDNEVLSSGTEKIARDPTSGLRSWRFDDSGATAEAVWTLEDKTWIIHATGLLSDGSETSAVSLLTPLNDTAFLWHSPTRTIAGESLPGTRPIKVTRAQNATEAKPREQEPK